MAKKAFEVISPSGLLQFWTKERLSFREAGRRKAAHSGSRERAALHPAPHREQQTSVGKLRDCSSSENEGFEAFPPRYQGASSPAAFQAAVIVLIMTFMLSPWAHLAEIRKTHDGAQIQRVGTVRKSQDGTRLQENERPGLPSVAQRLALYLQCKGARPHSLAGEGRPCMPLGTAQRKTRKLVG